MAIKCHLVKMTNFVKNAPQILSKFYFKLSKTMGLRVLNNVTPKNVVFITGTDSGLGYNLALYCHSLNMTVVAGCHNINSEGSKLLQNIPNPHRMIPVEIDITNQDTINKAFAVIQKLTSEQDYELYGLVNNAGIMCFGEFEWQTPTIFESQINVNLLGPMRVTHTFLPLIRKHCGRIINVTSHCGLQALPGLSAYAASKAGLRFHTDALRMEMRKFNVDVIDFVPGSFVTVSNIASKQQEYARLMWKGLSQDQRVFYGRHFIEYNSYLYAISGNKQPTKMEDEELFDKFQDALLNIRPNNTYIHEPIRYKIYRWLFKIPILRLRDYLILKFISMPQYKPKVVY